MSATIVNEIFQSRTIEQLAALRNSAEELVLLSCKPGFSIRLLATMVTEINDALISKILQLAEQQLSAEGFPLPTVAYCWLSCGSEGRKEQLLRTDQDNAIVYEDPLPEHVHETQKYFLRLAHVATKGLESCGFTLCLGNMMASNSTWCQPFSVWKKYFHDWIHIPNAEALLNEAIFFDFRPVYGKYALAEELRKYISHCIENENKSIVLLAKNVFQNPEALNIFKQFIVEHDGIHKNYFDIKLRGLKPLVDAARVLALDFNAHSCTNTIERLLCVAEVHSGIAKECHDAVEAYELLLRYRILCGFQHGYSGRYINPKQLSDTEQTRLYHALHSVKVLLMMMHVRYEL